MADDTSGKRKSVAFADGQTIVDSEGNITHDTNGTHDGDKDSAATHSKENGEGDKEVDEVTAMFEGLAKKKKKKPKKEAEEDADGEEKAEDDGEVDLSALKKKKKKKVKAPADDFEKQLAEAGAAEGDEEEKPSKGDSGDAGVQDGDIHGGTGVWAHDESKAYNYESLLSRFFVLLHDSHPDLASSGGKSYKIPPPQCLREGNKKTIFANIADICKRMKRTDEHVTQFLFAELGTSGSVDGSRRLVIKGRFQQKQIENVLRRYIVEYVTCKTCRSPDTELSKGENRLYFVTCNSCGSRRSVTAIKSGFSAQVGKRKRMQG
ncbi:Putative translation initiation factor IF2/IF5 domain-containing protein [Septoria linicola]|uniref:Translation initiation factor IF2/IF5 domain-containing protein n=1 Tax=Septoria linicola TaxID=215465 RepID=A0A9Q9AQI6_9PEZI|nr:putative translation initiation factor IF2/IF5 domain-containing protein [Septoria linicola]USW53872.1 Putative translation initiation factor IF2/IF5 domain-containing protein [Septoria linicola]